MRWWQRCVVHRVGEQHVIAQRLVDREAALVVLLHALVDAAIVAGEDELDGIVGEAGLLQDPAQRRARPLRAPDRVVVPRRRDRSGGQASATRAGALHDDRHGHGGPGAEVVERERQRLAHETVDAELVAGGVEVGDVEVHEDVVHARRRHGASQRLERHRRVAQGEPDLLASELRVRGQRHPEPPRQAYIGPAAVSRTTVRYSLLT